MTTPEGYYIYECQQCEFQVCGYTEYCKKQIASHNSEFTHEVKDITDEWNAGNKK